MSPGGMRYTSAYGGIKLNLESSKENSFLHLFVSLSSIVIYPQCKEINEAMLLRLMRPERERGERGGGGGTNRCTHYYHIISGYIAKKGLAI